jgi:hypothetical protein
VLDNNNAVPNTPRLGCNQVSQIFNIFELALCNGNF